MLNALPVFQQAKANPCAALRTTSVMPPDGRAEIVFLLGTSPSAAVAREHLLRAAGRHGRPLMGTGDWNDGMNRVSEAGKGESIWLGRTSDARAT